MNGSRTHLVLIDNQVPQPLGHHRENWSTSGDSNPNLSVRSAASYAIGRPAENWYGHEESNPDLYVRSVPSCPLDDARVKLWLAAQASNLEPPRSERGAPPIAPAASGRG